MIINWGDAPFKAFITVTYKKGTCTVSLGDKSYSHSGGGTHTFTVNKKGSWTVTAVSGSYSASSTVNISAFKEAKSVTLKYTQVLYDNGNQYSSITGGWEMFGGANEATEDGVTCLNASQDHNYTGHYTKNVIDLTLFYTLNATFISKAGETMCLQVVNSSATGDGVQGNGVYDGALASEALGYGAGTAILSIGANTSGKVRLCLKPSGYYKASKIWLE